MSQAVASPRMQRFIGHKTHEKIKAQCEQLGLSLADGLWKTGQSDHIIIEGGGARVYYSTVSGIFFGTTDQGVEFSSDNSEHEGEPWFQQLLEFFMVGRIEVKA